MRYVTSEDVQANWGYFYIIQLFPEIVPQRVKMGFTKNVDRRLGGHRTTAPTAKIVKVWVCHKIWERLAITAATGYPFLERALSKEVFDVENIEQLVIRVDVCLTDLLKVARGFGISPPPSLEP